MTHDVQAVFSHQGPLLERELAELKSSIQEADTAVETAKEALKAAGMVRLCSQKFKRYQHILMEMHLSCQVWRCRCAV